MPKVTLKATHQALLDVAKIGLLDQSCGWSPVEGGSSCNLTSTNRVGAI